MTPTPHFAARRRWTAAAWIAGVWIFLAVLQATQRYLRGRELEPSPWAFWGALADNLVIAALWAAATPVVMRIARRYAFPGTPVPVLAAVHLAAGAAFALLHSLAANVLYKLVLAPGVTWNELVANWVESALTTGPTRIATYLQIVGVTWGLDDYRAWREREIRASSLQLALAKERLESLKLQLHPAFLFQTLALLRTTIPRDPRAAARTIVELGDLLRLSLKNGGKRLVRLSEEVRYAELYLKIEKTRLECDLAVTIRVPRDALDAAVPSLVLQPLVEAAVAAACPAPASIEITASHGDGRMTLAVRAEPGDPAAPPAPAGPSAAVIERARRRLDLEFPGQHRLEWSSVTRSATVEIPFAPLPEGAESPAPLVARPAEGLAR
ncbi:MAG TPA: histidine kinase [Thermoanaerobaculia bacterium]|nr:histidine kinase [Thermoanaerobaculia bacterium]